MAGATAGVTAAAGTVAPNPCRSSLRISLSLSLTMTVHMEFRSDSKLDSEPQPLEPAVRVRVQSSTDCDFLGLNLRLGLRQRTLSSEAMFEDYHSGFSFPIALLEALLRYASLLIEQKRTRVQDSPMLFAFRNP